MMGRKGEKEINGNEELTLRDTEKHNLSRKAGENTENKSVRICEICGKNLNGHNSEI